jgi:uncharacterized protein (DUF302 family)
MVDYGMETRLAGRTLDEAKAIVTDALKQEGFGVLTEIDVRATLKNKLGVEIEPYVILGACNPQLAHRALEAERAAGLLLPCNVVLRQAGTDVVVMMQRPRSMLSVAGPALEGVAADAERRLGAALERLAG